MREWQVGIKSLENLFRGHYRCSHASKKWHSELDICDLNDKICLLESENHCEIKEQEEAENE